MNITVTDTLEGHHQLLATFAWKDSAKGKVQYSHQTKHVQTHSLKDLFLMTEAEQFEATVGQTFYTHLPSVDSIERFVIVGVGQTQEMEHRDVMTAAATIARRAVATGATSVTIEVPGQLVKRIGSVSQGGYLISLGLLLGAYRFDEYKDPHETKKRTVISRVSIVVQSDDVDDMKSGIKQGSVYASAVSYSRDLINRSPSETPPAYLAEEAKTMAKSKHITCTVLLPDAIKKLGMGALLAVSRGSVEPPRFVVLKYDGGGDKTVALIGKGITFDTGGLSLKPSSGMETMKLDMAGAAAVMGVFHALDALKPAVTVVGLIPLTENMPGPLAIKPGDVVRAANGKTIEILNTDAEGRLILADALSYADIHIQPDIVIDVATLTGACMVALGSDYAGLFGNNEDLVASLRNAAGDAGELLWPMPIAKEYKSQLKSHIADVKNIASKRWGGAITAALFLENFVPKRTPWAHMDIAGPAFAESETPLSPHGGTGYGITTILRWLEEGSKF